MIKPTVKRRTSSHSNRKRTDSAAQRPTRKTVKRKPTRQATTDQRRRYLSLPKIPHDAQALSASGSCPMGNDCLYGKTDFATANQHQYDGEHLVTPRVRQVFGNRLR
jgi:hypothetical protein